MIAGAIDAVICHGTDTGLGLLRVNFVQTANDQNAAAIDAAVTSAASAGIELGEVHFVETLAALADVLNDLEPGEAAADTVDQVLVDAAGVDADALLADFVVLVALGALAAEAVNGGKARSAVAVEGVRVEDFVLSAAITLGLVAVSDFDGGLAMRAVGVGLCLDGGGVVVVVVACLEGDHC